METVIADLIGGQYIEPVRIVGFNTVERWSEDVSEDVAREIRRRCDLLAENVPAGIADFVERFGGPAQQLVLRLA